MEQQETEDAEVWGPARAERPVPVGGRRRRGRGWGDVGGSGQDRGSEGRRARGDEVTEFLGPHLRRGGGTTGPSRPVTPRTRRGGDEGYGTVLRKDQ